MSSSIFLSFFSGLGQLGHQPALPLEKLSKIWALSDDSRCAGQIAIESLLGDSKSDLFLRSSR